jgi:hypothetical protein
VVPDKELLRRAAVLHDIGYSPEIAHTGFHALDGARHLRSLGVDERVVRLVAHHSCAEAEGEVRGLDRELRAFEHSDPLLEDALIYCDMTTTPDGEVTTVEARLAEILDRYGPESIVGRFITNSSGDLTAATHRIAAMLRPAGQPM